ncbi:22365_t:CDS:2 [Dentiscutata erythropus]|uniref:22365_t:CDS:1 n=1 Tax=Dentiscutata erythropus TaxID=1348616 RepID=A0A9N9C6F3_9GLOM|nr:22365_t:CDS:2 [Dentiscutata erythropus]
MAKRWKMKELIDFLQKKEDLDLDKDDLEIISKEKINGCDFLKISEEKLRSYKMAALRTLHGRNYGQTEKLWVDSLEAMRNEYVIVIARDNTQKKFSMRPRYEIVGNENTEKLIMQLRWDSEDLICVTENKQHQIPVVPERSHKLVNYHIYTIEFTEDALNKESEEYQILHKSVKRVFGVVAVC